MATWGSRKYPSHSGQVKKGLRSFARMKEEEGEDDGSAVGAAASEPEGAGGGSAADVSSSSMSVCFGGVGGRGKYKLGFDAT